MGIPGLTVRRPPQAPADGGRSDRPPRQHRATRPAARAVAVLGARLVAIAYLSGLAGLLWWSQAPLLLGWQPRVVLTGSMLPSVRPGDIAVVGPAKAANRSLPPGRVVLVRAPQLSSGYYLHRIVRYQDGTDNLITQGDANRQEDHEPVTPERVMGQLRLVVPDVGLPVVWLREKQTLRVAGVAAGTWIALTLVLVRRRVPAEPGAGRGYRSTASRPI
jgi:signal peptidase